MNNPFKKQETHLNVDADGNCNCDVHTKPWVTRLYTLIIPYILGKIHIGSCTFYCDGCNRMVKCYHARLNYTNEASFYYFDKNPIKKDL